MSDVKYPEFNSLEELNKFIEQYEQQNYVQLWKRDSRTIKIMKTVCSKKLSNCNLALQYYSITYACSKGGKQFKSQSKGLRRSATFKENCPMKIKVIITEDGQRLKVVNIDDNHNHAIEKDFFEALPKQRRLNSEEKKEATKLLTLNCNKKLVRSYLEEKTGKQIQLKDLSNLQFANRCSKTDLEKVFKIITQDDGFAHLATTEDEELVGIYYQTPYMMKCFSAYPDLVLLDVTHELNNLDMPLYIIMSINGNNEGDVCAIFLVTEESRDIIKHMMNVFKNNNPEWHSIKTFLTDKDFGEKSVLCEEFPDVVHQSCLFHILKRFRSAFTTKEMKITNSERNVVLNILQKMTCARSEEEYNNLHEKLQNLNHPKVTQYFNYNWHIIRNEWVEFKEKSECAFGVRTTTHLESFNQKIKQVCHKFSNLELFFENFMLLHDTVKQKRKQTAHGMIYKKEVLSMSPHEAAYMQLVTPHAFQLIKEQIQNVSNLEVSENKTYLVQNKQHCKDQFVVSKFDQKTCPCAFNVTYALPCSHIFSVRSQIANEALFNKDLIPERFLKDKYSKTYKGIESDQSLASECNSGVGIVESKKRILSTQQKFKIGLEKCEKIASIVSNFNDHDFEEHIKQLNSLIECWSQRQETKILLSKRLQLEELESEEYNLEQINKASVKREEEMEFESEEYNLEQINEASVKREEEMEFNDETITEEIEVQECDVQKVEVQEKETSNINVTKQIKGHDLTVIGLKCKNEIR